MATLEDRVLKIEVWKHDVNADLYGRDGTEEPGLVRDYWNAKAEHRGRQKLWTAFVGLIAFVQVLLGVLIAAKQLHIIN